MEFNSVFKGFNVHIDKNPEEGRGKKWRPA
jgi:hypothetical protein